MKDFRKTALKAQKKSQGCLSISCSLPLKKEADLGNCYYPGILGVLGKVQESPALASKFRKPMIGIISTASKEQLALISAKAAIVSQLLHCTAIPLLIGYQHPQELTSLIPSLSKGLDALFFTDSSKLEAEIVQQSAQLLAIPVFFQKELEAGAAMAALLNGIKLLGTSVKKAQIIVEGTGQTVESLLKLVAHFELENVTLIDERGPLYTRRPNMSREKNELLESFPRKKDARTRDEVLNSCDVYLSSLPAVRTATTGKLPEKAVIISLSAEHIEVRPKQCLASTLPQLANHFTDLHLLLGLLDALQSGKKLNDQSVSKAIVALANMYKTPKRDHLIPGLLEKNLAQKIAKGL
ncbi:MAG: hypothetical protein Q8P95_05050 [bacterium]|nr:hypothetical protein [bacterium]